MDSRMFATPRPRPQFANSSALGLDFDHKPISSISSSSTAATPSTSGSKSASTPNIASMISAASSFGTDQSYLDEISNMIDSSHLETPQACRIGNAASNLLRVPKQQPGVGSAGCSALRGAVGKTGCSTDGSGGGKLLLTKEQHSGVKEPQTGATHPTGVMGGSAMIGIFSSPKSFVCTLSSSRSTSAPYTPTVVDECSPPCSLPAPPGSDPFAIPSFGSEPRSGDPISGNFSAPLLNYLNDGLNSDSWGSFIPYTKITDYCFDKSPDSSGGTGGSSKHLHGLGNPIIAATTSASTPPGIAGINQSKWTGSIFSKSSCITTPGPGSKATVSTAASQTSLKANELLDFLLLEVIKDGGHTSQVFEQASQILCSATNLLAARFNKEPPTSSHHPLLAANKQQHGHPPVASSSSSPPAGGNWSPNTLGVGGPNFAAPTMLAHPDEFKNPSSFLKIYGDPLCGKQPSNTAPTTSSSSTISPSPGSSPPSLHDSLAGNYGAGFSNANPMKGHNGNWACCKCSNVNFPRRFRCFKCGEYRDEAGDKIVSEYAKHVYLHHLKAYKSLGSGNNGGNGGRSGAAAASSGTSSFGEGLRPVLIERSNSNSSGFSSASSSSLNYTDPAGGGSGGSKVPSGSACVEVMGSSTCSTNSSTAVSPMRPNSAAAQTAKKSSKTTPAAANQ